MISDRLQSEILATSRTAFDYLEAMGANRSVVEEPAFTTVVYAFPKVFFELELDWTEEAAFLLVSRGPRLAGRGYYADHGKVIRRHLVDALGRADLLTDDDRGRLRSSTRMSGPDAMMAQLKTYSLTLRRTVTELLVRYERVFEN